MFKQTVHNNKDKFGWVKINIGEWFVICLIRRSFPCQNFVLYSISIGDYKQQLQARDAPNMLKNLPIIPSGTSQNLSLLFFKIPPIIPKLFCSDSKKIMGRRLCQNFL